MGRPRVCTLVTNPIFDDPRVMKQVRAIAAAGRHDVHAIGFVYGGERRPAPIDVPGFTHETIDVKRPPPGRVAWARDVSRRASAFVPSGAWATHVFFAQPPERRTMLERAIAARAALYHANDWDTLPIACEAARATGARVLFDAHEMGTREFSSLKFRVFRRKLIERLEQRYLPTVERIVTVCQPIADALVADYGLDPRRVSVIRNAAPFQEVSRRPVDPGRVRVLYHGYANASRGLEDLVESVPSWKPHLSLALRIVGDPPYLESLRALVRARGLEGRISFPEPVPAVQLVTAAAEFDVGIMPVVGAMNWNNRICLPNKIFEYAMAGLAVFTTDLPEMRRVVEEHGLGGVFPERDPGAVASLLNALTPDAIAKAQANALAFSRTVNAEAEFARLVALYDEILESDPSRAGIVTR